MTRLILLHHGAGVEDRGALQVFGERLSGFIQRLKPQVRLIARRTDLAIQINDVADMQLLNRLVINGERQFIHCHFYSPT